MRQVRLGRLAATVGALTRLRLCLGASAREHVKPKRKSLIVTLEAGMASSMRLGTLFVFAGLLGTAALFSSSAKAQQHFETQLVPQMGHTDAVWSVAFSPDGHLALSGSEDNTLRLWEVGTGKELRSFNGHTGFVSAVAFSPDGRFALSGAWDDTVKLWNVATGQELRTFSGHTGFLEAVAFSPDGRFALSGGQDNKLKLWDIATGQELRTFSGHTGAVWSVAFSPDGRFILSGGADKLLKLWEADTGKELRSFAGHTGHVWSVSFFPDGRLALSGSGDKTLKIWDVATGEVVRSLGGKGAGIISAALSRDGRFALSGGASDGLMKLWDVATGQEIRSFRGHRNSVRSVAFSPDGQSALSGSQDGTFKLWDLTTGQERRSFSGHAGYISSVALSPDGRSALSGSSDNLMRLWDMATGKELLSFAGHKGDVLSVAFSPDGHLALSGSRDHTLKLWDVSSGRELRSFTGHPGEVWSVKFSADGRLALSGGGRFVAPTKRHRSRPKKEDTALRLWDVETGQQIRSFTGHSGAVRSVALSPDGQFALSGSDDMSMKLWEVATGKEVRSFSGHKSFVRSVAFSPDGRFALSGAWDDTVKLWDVATGQELRSFTGHSGNVESVAFSPDGRYALSGSHDNTLRLWEVATGKELRRFSGHAGIVQSVAFSPNARFILSGSHDGTARIWDLERGQELARMMAAADGEWLTMTPKGFFTASQRGGELLSIVRGLDAYSVHQFYDHLYRPDLVEELLKGDAQGKYVDAASKLNLETILDSGSAPKLELLEKNHTERSEDGVNLSVRIKDAGGGIGEKVVWRVNGKTQGDLTVPGLQGPPSPGRFVTMSQELKVDRSKSNIVEVTAYNGQGLLASLPLQVTVDPFGVTTTERPKLHVLAAGVDKYAMGDLGLRYAVKDAQAFAAAMQSAGSTLFSEVRITALRDGEVTKSGLEAAVNKLASEVKPTDVFVLFLSGHGRSIAGKYYFLQQDLDFAKGQSIEKDAISQDLWQAWLAKIPAEKTLLIYDTCESAAASGLVRGGENGRETAMDKLQNATGQNLIAAAREAAYEGYEGHGVLTYAILEAFRKLETPGGKAQEVGVDRLAHYIGKRVPEITTALYGVRQEPIRKLTGEDFPLGLRILSVAAPNECPAEEEFVIIKSEPLRDNPDDTAPSGRTLTPGYRVGAKFSGSWALICRDGAKLGYLRPESIAKTN
ncbi:MAG: caspase family protein [Rhodomicrobiaceae bacterium]